MQNDHNFVKEPIERYCSVIDANIMLVRTYFPGGKMGFECLNKHKCNNGVCYNKKFSNQKEN